MTIYLLLLYLREVKSPLIIYTKNRSTAVESPRKMQSGTNVECITTLGPNGRLIQLERAMAAVSRGAISVGITTSDGVVLAADSTPPSPLYDVHSVRRIEKINEQICMVYSGVGPDYNILVKAARKAAQLYYLNHMKLMPATELAKSMGNVMAEFTKPTSVRPFGVSLLISSWSDCSPHLCQVDPTGRCSDWKVTALGKNAVRGREFLEDRYSEVVDIEDAIYTAFLTLKQGFVGEMIADNIEIGVSDENGFRRIDPATIQEYLICLGLLE